MQYINKLRASLGSNLARGEFDFDVEGCFGNSKTKNYLHRVGIDFAYEQVKKIGIEIYNGEHYIKISRAESYIQSDAFIIKVKDLYLKAFVGRDLQSNRLKWFVVFHD